jgi:predicted RNA-binding protein YlqC (UPF0109 family)
MIKEILEHVVQSLATKPELVTVEQTGDENNYTFEIVVNEADRGRIIGKDGQTVRALRMLAQAAAGEGQTITVTVR